MTAPQRTPGRPASAAPASAEPACADCESAPDDTAWTPEERERLTAWRRGERRTPERPDDSEPSGVVGAVPAARLAAAGHAFAAFAEHVRDYAIFLMDPAGTIMFWGEGARHIKGWTKLQAEGAHLRLLYPPGGSEDGTAEAHLDWAAAHGEYSGEGQRIRSDGGSFWARATVTALRDAAGALLGFAKLSCDLTANRAAEALRLAASAAAEEARAAAEAASAAKSGFLATISHEIRTPVNAILGYTELIALEIAGPLTDDQRRYLQAARGSGEHLLALIGQVLDFSRVAGTAQGNVLSADELAAVDLAAVVTAAVARVRSAAAARGVVLIDAVRDSTLALTGWGDAATAGQILGHLLDNAVKFSTARDGPAGRITVRAGTATLGPADAALPGSGPWVYVAVEDTGVGIPADRLDAVFEPFVQADMRLTRAYGGLGLGLAISRRLARRARGDVTARSALGAGSTFWLWLPAAGGTALAAAAASASLGARAAPGSDIPGSARTDAQPAGSLGEHATGDSAPAPSDGLAGGRASASSSALRAVAEAVLGELARILHAYVARLQTDPGTPSARAVDEAKLEDHLASFLGNLAATLPSLGDAEHGDAALTAPVRTGTVQELAAEVQDGAAIQRVVAQRHGAQRARLGWREAEVRREYAILREELTAAVRRRTARGQAVPTTAGGRRDAAHALAILTEFLALAEQASLTGYHAAVAAGRAPSVRGPGSG